MVFYPDIPSGFFLSCTSSGTTGSVSLDFSSISNGQVYRDGTVSWSVYNFSNLKNLTNLVDNVQTILDKIGTTIPDIDFSKATREILENYTVKNTSWNGNISIEIPYSGYYYLYGRGTYSGYTGSRAMYMQIGSNEIMRTSSVGENGRDTTCGPVWIQAGTKNANIGYVGFSEVMVCCVHV